MLRDRLTRLEYHLQALIEGTAARLFPSSRKQKDLASQLVEAMRQGIRNEPTAHPSAQICFLSICHPHKRKS